MNRFLFLLPFLVATSAMSQVSYNGGTYIQDFNSLQGTTNNTTGVAWTDNSTLPGWYAALTTGAVPTYGVTNGTMGGSAASFDGTGSSPATNINNVGLLSFGASGSTDRALGSRSTSNWTGHGTVVFGIRLVNNTAQPITAFNVIFTGEQWHKNGATTAHTLPLQYQIGATSITDTDPWTSVAIFSSPVNTTTIASLDGNASANRRGVAARVAGISWAPGGELWLRIADGNESGNEQAMGIDDFVFNTDGNSALFFNGATNHVTMGAATSTLGASNFTLEAWIFRTGNGTTTGTGTGGITAVPVVTKGRSENDNSGFNCNYFMGIDASNRLVADFEAAAAAGITTGQNYPVTGTSTIPFMQWTHLAATYDGAAADGEKWKLYINGVKDTSNATPGVNTAPNAMPEAISTQHFAIGTAMTSTGAREGTFLGIIDEVRVWNTARSGGDILDGKDEEISAATGLLGRYGLNEGTGTTTASSVAGSPNGTLVNSPVWLHGRSFTLNTPPVVAITAPADGFSVMAPAVVNITATAEDTDGSIVKVEFFEGDTKIGEDTSDPWQYDWNRSLSDTGTFSLTAVATDSGGESTTSEAVSVTITPSTNAPPAIAITSPEDDATFDALATIIFTADASDSDGSVTKVEFFSGSTKIGEATTAPWSFTWSNVVSGVYFISATAIDDIGMETTTPVINIFVTNDDNFGPSVLLTSPADGAEFTAGSTVALAASATDSDGVIAKVQFYEGAVLLGEDTSAPFSFDWVTPAIDGSYTVTAVATDNDGASSTSAEATITLSPAPPFSYTQDFNSMGTSGTAPPAGWSIKNGASGTTNSTWTTSISASVVAAMVNITNPLTASNSPTANNNNGYNAARPGDTANRMIATAPTTNAGTAIQLQLTNTSGAPVTSLRLSYDIQRFIAVATENELPGYWVFYSLDNGTTWTNIPALNPVLSGGTVNVPNTTGVTTIPPTPFSISSAWANGATLLLRWVDDNAVATSPDQIIGLDNVTLASAIGAAPTATMTAPANGTTYVAPASVSFAADANDSDGTIVKVEFYNGVSKVGEDTIAPYTFDWTNVTAGTYALTAIATDDDGNPGASAAVTITVNPAPGSGTLTRGPYLQKAGPTRMTIRWRSGQTVAGRVRYGTSVDNLDQTVDESAGTTEHIIELTGLTPATTYFYSIGSPFDTLASGANYTFTTSPVPGTPLNTRIWALGDAGTANANQAAVRDAFYTWTGTRVPEMVLQLGDNAYNSGTDSEFQNAVFNVYSTMLRKTPFWSCLGNHETAQSTAFVDTYPYFNIHTFPTAGECGGVASGTEHYFSWDYGNIHFISLDSMTASRSPTGAMATWLQADLASTTATWIICIYHHPSYTKGSHNSDTETELIQMRQNFNPIMEAGGVDLVLNGHSHCYERSYLLDGHYGLSGTLTSAMKVDPGNGRVAGTGPATPPPTGPYTKPLTGPRDHFGTVYCVTGSAGQISGGSLNHPAFFISLNNLGSLVLDISGNRLDATFIRENGAIPDTFTIFKQGAADSDNDGLPDEWEIASGLNRHSAADAAQDNDGDGLTNLQEFQAGTSATSSADTPQVAGITLQPDGSVVLQLNTVNGKSYKVEANDSFPSGPWTIVADNVAGTGGIVVISDPGAAGVPGRVYRVTVLP